MDEFVTAYFDGGYNNKTKSGGYYSTVAYKAHSDYSQLFNVLLFKEYFVDIRNNKIHSSNEAEYLGLISVLESLSALPESLRCGIIYLFTDSQLVHRQMLGEYKVKAKNLAKLHRRAKKLYDEFPSLRLMWVTRKVMVEEFGH